MKRKVAYDQGLLLLVLGLVGFGLVMVFSASSMVSRDLFGSSSAIFTRQLLAVVLGLATLLVTMRIDYHLYNRQSVVALLLGISLLLLASLFLTPGSAGVRRWLHLGPVNFQPSELAKLAVIFWTAFYLVRRQHKINVLSAGLLPYALLVGGFIALILVEPDLGTAASIGLTAAFLLLVGGLDFRYFLGAAALAAPLLYLLVIRVPYRLNRVLAFLDASRDPYGIGYQIRQSLIAVGSGGWTGLGYAQGQQKLFFLPEPHTDFIYAVVGEELGLLGCATLLILFALLFWRGVRIALRADTPFGTFLGLGIVAMIVFQAFINMSVVLSLVPTKGLPLPFVSVGGSSTIVMLAAVGILLNISQQTRERPERPGWGG